MYYCVDSVTTGSSDVTRAGVTRCRFPSRSSTVSRTRSSTYGRRSYWWRRTRRRARRWTSWSRSCAPSWVRTSTSAVAVGESSSTNRSEYGVKFVRVQRCRLCKLYMFMMSLTCTSTYLTSCALHIVNVFARIYGNFYLILVCQSSAPSLLNNTEYI